MSETDIRHMRAALAIGARGLGRVWPNPAVGCVVVKEGRVVGRGATLPDGRHAETVALAQAGALAKGATAYVTLEPCAHHGKTPPCTEALIAAGIARVVIGINDPDPRVDGAGAALLQAAGIDVAQSALARDCTAANAGFISKITLGRPFITLKLASSLDGRIATATGESKWITGPESRRAVHAMRANHDAVMVGAGTARADNPSLTVRDLGTTHQPVRIVLSRHLDLPLQGKLAMTAGDVPLWIVHGEDTNESLISAWRSLGVTLIPCKSGNGRQIDLISALTALGQAGLTRVFCEGGGALAASLLSRDLVDELVTFTAGLSIGAEGQPMLGALGLDRLATARRFERIELRAVGADVMVRWRRLPIV